MRLSSHPSDRLIRALIDSGRPATEAEVEQIVERMAAAPFDPRTISTHPAARGRMYLGRVVGTRENALLAHLAKRALADRQWAVGTTESEYLEDLRRVARNASARVGIYERRGGHLAVAVVDADRVLAPRRRGAEFLPHLLVVYSADRGMIVSGYLFSELAKTGIPAEVRWLK